MARRFVSDVRYALRLLRRNPGFSAVAVLVLALAIGVNTAAFGLVDALLFKSLPVRAPDELVRVAATATDGAMSYADYLDYRSARSLSGLAGFTAENLEYRAAGSDQTERVAAYLVTDDYFTVLGVDLALGRGFTAPSDGSEPPGVVLSDAFWRTRFAADPGVLGRSVWLNGASFAVIGVGAGAGLSLAVGWLMRDALLGASFDPGVLILAPLALAATAFLAVALPVFRAASLDPMTVLRDE